jgi:hypothetical protein
MVERDTLAENPGPQGWCVCGQKVIIADAREVTLPNGRPGWQPLPRMRLPAVRHPAGSAGQLMRES